MTKKTKNVVDLGIVNKNKASSKVDLGSILPEIHLLFIKGLKPGIGSFYNNLDDSLFDLAEKSETNEKQNLYFDAMREIRKKKDQMLRIFSDQIKSVFKKFKRSEFDYFERDEMPEKTQGKLSLVDETELEQKLAITNLVNKANTVFHEHLFALEKRFSLLSGGNDISAKEVPISPHVAVNAFACSLDGIDSDVTVKLIIFKLFERSLLSSLNEIYIEINKFLIEKGIYPNIKFSLKPGQGGGYSAPRMPASQAIDPNLPQDMPGVEPGMPHAAPGGVMAAGYPAGGTVDPMYQQITQMLSARRAALGPQGGSSNMPAFEMPLLSNAMSLLQSDLVQQYDNQNYQPSPIEIKNQLLEKIKSLDADAENKRFGQQEQDTIDLVGMLFQFLVEDRNLPDKIQVLLAKLQIPYLHLALKDRKLFSNRDSSARKLLDTLAQASIGWTEDNDRKNQFINKLQSIIDHILENHEEGVNFGDLTKDFNEFNEKYQKRAQIAEKRTSEKALGEERVLKAKNTTAQLIKEKMGNTPLPGIVSDILMTPWANVLILNYLRHGEDSDQFKHFARFVDQVIIGAKKNKKKNLTEQNINVVCDRLSQGLKLVAVDNKTIMEKRTELYNCLADINGLDSKTKLDDSDFIKPEDIIDRSKQNAEQAEIFAYLNDDENEPIELQDDDCADAVSKLNTGDWVEFTQEENQIKAKLSWISPITKKLLFVNSRGLKVTDREPARLAQNLREKTARILKNAPLFDRALNAIAKKVKADEASQKEKDPS